jgi:hypothetical protein
MVNPNAIPSTDLTGRREFIRRAVAGGLLATMAGPVGIGAPGPETGLAAASPDDRTYWFGMMRRICEPVIENLAAQTLRAHMPVEAPAAPRDQSRKAYAHLEAFGRTVAGVAPWIELPEKPNEEAVLGARLSNLVRRGLDHATTLGSPDALNFTQGGQPLVDGAFLAYGLVLAPQALWRPLPAEVKTRVIAALCSTRQIQASPSNWLLFPAMIEAFLAVAGAEWQPERIDRALSAHESWYKGDGVYGDGNDFHWDYYNSYVIQPFLVTILTAVQAVTGRWESHLARVSARSARYAAIQERLIAPDGSFPVLGRSMAYRTAAFHHLAHQAWRGTLPTEVAPAQVRCALTAVIRRTLEPDGTFDAGGWLRVGLAGHQPSLAEPYISTGSLYLCSLVFHPLGLPANHRFWRDPAVDWTQRRIWSGVDTPADHALKEA